MRFLNKENLAVGEDWYGNNAAVTCFKCGKVFLTSQILHRKGRACPQCGACKVLFTKAGVSVSEAGDPA
jgi:predicted  nucleic acid-binding Zn-ribbon protein